MGLGLIGWTSALSGAAKSLGDSMDARQAAQDAIDLEKARNEAALQRAKIIADYAAAREDAQAQKKIDLAKSVSGRADEIGAAKIEGQANSVEPSNPDQAAFIRDQMGTTEENQLKNKVQAADEYGQSDLAQTAQARLNGLISSRRADTAEKKSDALIEHQLKQDEESGKRADRLLNYQVSQLKHAANQETASEKKTELNSVATLLSKVQEDVKATRTEKAALLADGTSPDDPRIKDVDQRLSDLQDRGDTLFSQYASKAGIDVQGKEAAPPKNGWDSETGAVYANGKSIGSANTAESARAMYDAAKNPKPAAAAAAVTPPVQAPDAWAPSTGQGRDVTPYADRLKALMDRQPLASDPPAKIKAWQEELRKLKSSQDLGNFKP